MEHSLPISLAAEPVLHIGGFTVTNTLFASLIVTIGLVIILLFMPRKLQYVPRGIQNFWELVYEQLDNFVSSVIENMQVRKVALPLVATFFLYILLNNWLGLLPGFGSIGFYEIHRGSEVFVPLLRGANSDLNMTLALGLVSVVSLQYFGLRFGGFAYLKKFFNFKNPIYTIVGILELISDFVKIFSFTFRLYGNIFAGEVLLTVIAAFVPFLAPLPFLGLEIFTGLIQALVFSMLTLVFINMATQPHDAH